MNADELSDGGLAVPSAHAHFAGKHSALVARTKSTQDFAKLEEIVVHTAEPQLPPRLALYDKTDKADKGVRRLPADEAPHNHCASISYAVVFFFVSLTAMMHVMNYVHYRLPVQPPLPDVGHELTPVIRPENIGDYPMIASAIIVIGLCVFYDRTDLSRALPRFLVTLGSMYLLRMLTISLTSLPVTDNHCRFRRREIASFWRNTIWGLVTLGMKNVHCGDLMFSGHTVMITLLWQISHSFFARLRAVNWLVTFATLLSFFLIMATRSHYTFDILIGWFVTTCAWKLVPNYWPWALQPTGPNATVG